jgi:hypothetical protein
VALEAMFLRHLARLRAVPIRLRNNGRIGVGLAERHKLDQTKQNQPRQNNIADLFLHAITPVIEKL